MRFGLGGALALGVGLVFRGAAFPEEPQLNAAGGKKATVFECYELAVSPPKFFESLPATQLHDAYDADRDGRYARLDAEFRREGESVTVPGFAMQSAAGGAWEWRVRMAFRRPGTWRVRLRLEAGAGVEKVKATRDLPWTIEVEADERLSGPLVAPGKNDPPRYLRRLKSDGGSQALWLFGACRAWVSEIQDANNDWSPHECLDRETELLAPMRAGGFNLLNQWMAPWEFLIVHHDRAEFWREKNQWRRVERSKEFAWTSYQCYDQGRARAFDDLVRLCEGDAAKATVYLLLSPLPHQCLQVKEHPWGGQESGWNPENDAGKQTAERLNGFSGFSPKMEVWEFFAADPRKPLADRRSQFFDHQANYWRYLTARWGYSRALGVWVLVDELDAVGDVVGRRAQRTGWWGHPDCERWLADMVRLFRGELKRGDGLWYSGDPFRHPLHAATTSFGGEAGRGGNIDWEGGPEGARPDLFGFHWYPHWEPGADWTEVWDYTIKGVAAYSSASIGPAPRLISEFGAPDRAKPSDTPSSLYPTLFHHAIWAAVFSGQAGTPMDWDDGKQFGELRWRERAGVFDQAHYPVDHAAQLAALRKFLGELTPDRLAPCGEKAALQCRPEGTLRAFVLHSTPKAEAACGWLFVPKTDTQLRLLGLPAGAYVLRWYDPWTGEAVAGVADSEIQAREGGEVRIDCAAALRALRAAAAEAPFPARSRLARGRDAAFKLERAGKP